MEAPDLTLTLLLASDDPPVVSSECQKEFWTFWSDLSSHGVTIYREWPPRQHAEAVPSPMLGEFFIRLAAALGPVLGTAVGAWLHGRYGRKVRLKIGEIEVEAQTLDEMKTILSHVPAIQQRIERKIIQEP